VIKSFKCKETERIWNGTRSKKFQSDIQSRALRKLYILDAALVVDDLKNPPGNHLEGLVGNRKGQMSIRINNQWRLCFVWENGEVFEVEIVDYH
jgi:proteic killer suppression protein